MIQNGTSDYQIVTVDRFAAADAHAARILQDGLFRMTGVRLPVRWGSQRLPYLPAILVGYGREGSDAGLWDTDSYEITPVGGDLVLRGSAERGTHYAVHAFLESVGARFYGPDVVELPALKCVDLPKEPVSSEAAFSYRHVFYPTAQEPEWAIRWKLNVHNGRDARWGRNAAAHSIGHSFNALVPLSVHFDEHPEYFSLVDGARRRHRPQLCCTNPEVADVACESMARLVARHPDRRIFAVGMNDWDGWCECPECTEADRREGGHIGQLLTLVNRVAERFPDRIIATLAYMWALDAPKRMHALDNVLIVLCHNEACFNHSLESCAHNAPFVARLRAWKQRAAHILIWDYYVNYHSYLMPTPNLRRIEADMRLYRDIGIEGMFCQGSAVRGGQFEGLRQYLLARMLWNPDLDAWTIVGDWLRAAYGTDAAEHIVEYLALLHDHVDTADAHMLNYGRDQEIQPDMFPPHLLKKGRALWDAAEKAAAGTEMERRVFAARAPEMCSRLFNSGVEYVVADGRLRPEPPADLELRDRFVDAAILGGAAHLRENDAAPEEFRRLYGREYSAVTLENDLLQAVVVPELGGRIYSIRWKPSDTELLRIIDLIRFVNYSQYRAGYEFAVDRETGLGAQEEYEIAEREAATAVTVEGKLPGERVIRTCVRLAKRGVALVHEIENSGREPVRVVPATHPEWNYALFGPDALVQFTGPDGSQHSTTINPERRRGRDLRFRGDQMPDGRWRIRSGEREFAIEEVFDATEVEETRIAFYERSGCLDMDLHFRERTIEPGERRSFSTEWRFLPGG